MRPQFWPWAWAIIVQLMSDYATSLSTSFPPQGDDRAGNRVNNEAEADVEIERLVEETKAHVLVRLFFLCAENEH